MRPSNDPRGDLSAQPLQTEERIGTGPRDLGALGRPTGMTARSTP
jgi:hypothetical protein